MQLKRKIARIALSSLLLFGTVVAIDEAITVVQPTYQVVYADDIVLSKSTEEHSSNSGDFVNPANQYSTENVTAVYNNYLYLSSDGKTRYLKRYGGSSGVEWYVWKADSSNEYGGTWSKTGSTPITKKTKADKTELAQIFESTYGYAYTSSPTEIKSNKEEKAKEQADNQASANQQSGADESNSVSAEDIAKYNNYISLGDKPTPATLLASIILKGGNSSGIDKANVSLDNIAKYPKSTEITAKIKGEDVDVNVYEYGNISDGSTNTDVGGTTANIIKVLTRYGWLTTNNDNENSTPWYVDLYNNISNPIYAVGSIIATILGVIADALSSIFQAVIDGAGTVIGWLMPVKIFGIVGDQLNGIATADNWFTKVMKTMVELIFGKGDNATFKYLLGTAIALSVVWALFEFGFKSAKEGIKRGLVSAKSLVAKIAIWMLGIAMLPLLYSVLNTSSFSQAVPTTDDLKSEISFNSEKFFVATNGDISVLYPEKFGSVKTSRVLSNSELDKTFKPSPSDVLKANQAVENLLGSELSAQIDERQKTSGTLDGVVNNSTWNVNDYLTGIASAGKRGADGTLNTNVTANKLPSGLSWNENVANNHMTVSVTPTNSSGDNIQDTIKQGWFLFKGLPIWFDSIADTGTSEEVSYVSAGGWTGIKFSQNLYEPTQIDPTKPETYLYGATSNNNDMTLNVSNYTFYSAMTLNNDFMKAPKNNAKVEDGEEVKKTNKSKNGEVTPEISDKLEKTKTPLTTANVQWRNAYMLAMYNKYAGTSASDINSFMTAGNMGFSNQSTMILLQSTYNKNKLSYSGYNTPNSKSDNSKAQTKDNVYMTTYATIGTGTSLMNTLSRTSYGLIARAIVMFGITVCIFQYGLGIVVKDSWAYFGRWLGKGSATGLLMIVVTTLYYFFIFNLVSMVSGISLYMIEQTINQLRDDGLLQTTTTFGVGLVLIGLALALTWRFIKINGRKSNFISLFFMGMAIGYDTLKGIIERLDVAIYGEREAKTRTEPSRIDDEVSRRVVRGGDLVRSSIGSFIGNTLADKATGDSRGESAINLPTGDEEGNSKDVPNNATNREQGRFNLPLGVPFTNGYADESDNDSSSSRSGRSSVPSRNSGMIRMAGKALSVGKKVATAGAMFNPVTGWGVASYMGARGLYRAYSGLRNGANTLKQSDFGKRLGLSGRKEQLKARYGLADDNELSANIKSGRIKPRAGEQAHFERFTSNNDFINDLEQTGRLTSEQKNSIQKVNAISGKAPTTSQIRETVDRQNEKNNYVQNEDVRVKPTTKAVVVAKAIVTGNLTNHLKKTVPQRRESYRRQQAKREFDE